MTSSSIYPALNVLRSDGIVLMQCDTVLGLIGRATPGVNKRLQSIKKRNKLHPFLLLVPNASYLEKFSLIIGNTEKALIEKFWPGPLTIIFDFLPKRPAHLSFFSESIGIRYPLFEPLNTLLDELNEPLLSTSANLSGEPTPCSMDRVSSSIIRSVDHVYDTLEPALSIESTIVKCTHGIINVVRKGAIDI